MHRLLEEKGWSLRPSRTPGDIGVDDNGVELFREFYLYSFTESLDFRKNRVKYPLTYQAFDRNEVIDNWDKIQKDSLTDVGKHTMFIIPTNSSRVVLWKAGGNTIQNIFTTVDKRWYLTKIIVTKD
jgi:hypothetical protein